MRTVSQKTAALINQMRRPDLATDEAIELIERYETALREILHTTKDPSAFNDEIIAALASRALGVT